MNKPDLHAHSYYSDGVLSPADLIARAQANEVDCFALTDHDTVAGIAEAQAAVQSLQFIPGIELSCLWNNQLVHVVGLNININASELVAAVEYNQDQRVQRAYKISEKLANLGIKNAFETINQYPGMSVGRLHFARLLIKAGLVSKTQSAFKQFLLRGKPAYVPVNWISLEQAVSAITQAGGIAVIAHPRRYSFSFAQLRRLTAEFKQCGGQAIEVATPNQNADDRRLLASLCREYDLHASLGSDFHQETRYFDIGRLPPLPDDCVSIVELL